MKLIVGLGNPGPSYLLNRHNVGFILMDMLHNDYGFQPFKMKYNTHVAKGTIGDHDCLIIKPMTFMNKSGDSVSNIANFYKIPPEDVFVAHDELDAPFRKIKVKQGGGAGGHNGLRSIDQRYGKEYHRIRIGIDHPGHKDAVTGHVLGNFSKSEIDDLPYILGAVSDEMPLLLDGDTQKFLTFVSRQIQTAFN